MRHFLLLLFFALPASSQSLYDNSTIHELRVEFYVSAWKDSLLAHVPTETDIPARLTVNGLVLDSIGIRYKGNSSYNVPSDKKPFNLSLDAFRTDQLLYGYKTLNLNNFFKDPTCVREKIAYDIASAYFPSAKSAFVKLYINGVYWGLYLNVQQLNKIFLREHFSAQGGNMFKGDPPLGGVFGADMSWHGTDTAYYRTRYELKTNEEANDWSDFIHLLDVLNNTPDASFATEIVTVLNVDRALWYLAWCDLFVNLDSYPGSGHNYYLYDNPRDGMNIILWDVNEVLGTFSSEQMTIQQRESLSPLYKSTDASRPLVRRLLGVPAFRRRYYAHFRTMFEEVFSQGYWQPLITKYQDLITAPLNEDTKKLYTMSQFTSNVTGNLNTTMGVVPGILSMINNRRTYLSSLPELSSPRPSVTALAHVIHEGGDSVSFIATAGGASELLLWWSKDDGRFTPTPMVQDGSSATRWTVTLALPAGPGDNRYYCDAVNAGGLATVYPPHAAYDTRSFASGTGSSSSAVTINEIMASNTKTITDPQGEYDDWVELHNSSADTVHLDGWWMSDDLRPQWRFPSSTVIPPHGYLVVWADDDTLDAGGVHANFKLSKSGEAVSLWDSTGTLLLDSTTFGAQLDDRAWARTPDGSGTFRAADPTPGAMNSVASEVSEQAGLPLECHLGQNYPNPFNPSTMIPYTLASRSRVRISIVDMLGRTVALLADVSQQPGSYTVSWRTDAASGVYICRMEVVPADGQGQPALLHRKMLLMR